MQVCRCLGKRTASDCHLVCLNVVSRGSFSGQSSLPIRSVRVGTLVYLNFLQEHGLEFGAQPASSLEWLTYLLANGAARDENTLAVTGLECLHLTVINGSAKSRDVRPRFTGSGEWERLTFSTKMGARWTGRQRGERPMTGMTRVF
jgi:hypothetical protein